MTVTPDTHLRVVLVDDHELIRQGLRRAFERAGDFDVVVFLTGVGDGVSDLGRGVAENGGVVAGTVGGTVDLVGSLL